MSSFTAVHKKHLHDNFYRELSVFYDKGSVGMWTHEAYPRGVYFMSQSFELKDTCRSFCIGPSAARDSGKLLVAPLANYKPTALKRVIEFVKTNCDTLHDMLDAGQNSALIAFLESGDVAGAGDMAKVA